MRGIRVTDLLPKLAAMTMKLCNCSKEFSFSAKKMGTKFVTYVRRGEGITFTSQKVQDLLRESDMAHIWISPQASKQKDKNRIIYIMLNALSMWLPEC